jgi:excisionase family DNA binding protein
MADDFVSLQEAANHLGKSVQTVRRMIKKGELTAERMRTPQGFQYVMKAEELGIKTLSSSTIQKSEEPEPEAKKEVLTNQTEILTSQTEEVVQPKAVLRGIDKKEPLQPSNPACDCAKKEKMRHEEKMALFRVIEKLQTELDHERRKPRTFMAHLMDRFF